MQAERNTTELIVEGRPSIVQPSLTAVHRAVERMRSTGPSFVIIERGSDYAQAGGGPQEFTVERRILGEPFVHMVAGKGEISTETHRIQMSGGSVPVRRHEILAIDDVKALLGGFLMGNDEVPGFLWRDSTGEFTDEPEGPADSEITPPT